MEDVNKIICPSCGKEMKIITIENLRINIDVCLDGCGGIFFDNREFKKIEQDETALNFIKSLFEGKEYPKTSDVEKRFCPKCGASMVMNFSNFDKTVAIDECYVCGGKFLDYGELEKITVLSLTEEQKKALLTEQVRKLTGENYPKIERPRKQSLLKSLFDSVFKF